MRNGARSRATLWVIPPERHKPGIRHVVPLSDQAMQLIDALPRRGEHLFTMNGRQPVNAFAYSKKRLDAIMGVSGWRLHDLRRTMRSHLSALGVSQDVAELAIGHGRSGLARIYDQYSFERELRDALAAMGQQVARSHHAAAAERGEASQQEAQERMTLPPLDPDYLIEEHDPARLHEYATGLLHHLRAIRGGKPANGYGVGMIKAAADWLLARYAEAKTPAPAEAVMLWHEVLGIKPTPRARTGARVHERLLDAYREAYLFDARIRRNRRSMLSQSTCALKRKGANAGTKKLLKRGLGRGGSNLIIVIKCS